MEFRGNIIFSILVHASVAMMTLAFAGRNTALSRPPENYIAVSLLEYAEEKKSAPGDKFTQSSQVGSKKPEVKPRKVLPRDSDKQGVNHNEEAPSQYPKSNPSDEEKGMKETRNPDTGSGMTPAGVPEQPVPLQDRQAGLGRGPGDSHTIASSSGVRAAAPGSSLEITMMGPHPAGRGADSSSLIDRIRASIEKAKIYPVLAKKRGQEGTVVTEFSIDGKGRPENIRVVKSSGLSLLDAAARDTIIRAAPFPVIKGNIEVPIRFTLK